MGTKNSTKRHKRFNKFHKRLSKWTQKTQQRDTKDSKRENFAKGDKCPPKVKTVHTCLEKSQMKKRSGFATSA